jgi:pantetheine-phosphate adenylyltransferase
VEPAREGEFVKVGLFPGSFDPFHNGHLEIVERASRLFDEVVVAALRNPQKSSALFDLAERKAMLEEVVAPFPSVRIVSVSTLLVNVARDVGASAIVRGLRAVSDFETEMQMAQMNHHLSGVETIFLPTSSKYSFIHSKLLREVAQFGGDVSAYVPKVVAEHLAKKFEDGPGVPE